VQFTVVALLAPTAIDADFVDDDTYAGRCALAGGGVGIAIENDTLTVCGAFGAGADACGSGCCVVALGIVPPPPQPTSNAKVSAAAIPRLRFATLGMTIMIRRRLWS
jgi:hypothetical protein